MTTPDETVVTDDDAPDGQHERMLEQMDAVRYATDEAWEQGTATIGPCAHCQQSHITLHRDVWAATKSFVKDFGRSRFHAAKGRCPVCRTNYAAILSYTWPAWSRLGWNLALMAVLLGGVLLVGGLHNWLLWLLAIVGTVTADEVRLYALYGNTPKRLSGWQKDVVEILYFIAIIYCLHTIWPNTL